MISFRVAALAALLLLPAASASAHDGDTHGTMPGMNMQGMDMSHMSGMHEMSATVTSIDKATGLVDVDAGGMKLRLHFPVASLASVKAGDKITVHLSFSKP